MSRHRMADGTIIDTNNAKCHYDERTDWDGNNYISRATDSQWRHQTLYESRKGRFYVVHESQWQGSSPHAEWVSPEEAVRWLLLMERAVPDSLQAYIDTVSE